MNRHIAAAFLLITLLFPLLSAASQTSEGDEPRASTTDEPLVEGMEQSTALPETREFSKLVGEWDASIVRRNRDGSWPDEPTRALWRWYLILDGSAIQDDWISLTDAGPGEEPIQRVEGTNIRIYHPEEALWHMAWIDRTNRKLATFTATDENGTVTMTGQNAQGRLVRITFSDITETTFNWQQEWTTDGGTNWFAVATMNCTRRK